MNKKDHDSITFKLDGDKFGRNLNFRLTKGVLYWETEPEEYGGEITPEKLKELKEWLKIIE